MVAFKKLPWVAVDPLDWAMSGRERAVSIDDLARSASWTYCSSLGYRPSEGDAWKRGRRRYQYHGLHQKQTNTAHISETGHMCDWARCDSRAGINRHMTEPLLPATLQGTV